MVPARTVIQLTSLVIIACLILDQQFSLHHLDCCIGSKTEQGTIRNRSELGFEIKDRVGLFCKVNRWYGHSLFCFSIFKGYILSCILVNLTVNPGSRFRDEANSSSSLASTNTFNLNSDWFSFFDFVVGRLEFEHSLAIIV